MYSEEQDHLLKCTQNDKCTGKHNIKRKWRTFTILCILDFLYFETVAMLSYIINEWTQHTIKLEYFPESELSKHNFSACVNFNRSSEEYKSYTQVQQTSAHWVMYYSIALHVPALVSSVIFSCYTDTFGRKFLFILPIISVIIRAAVLCVVIYMKQSFLYVVGAYAVEGIFGSYFAFVTASFLCVADIFTDKKSRVLAVVFIEANMLISVMISGLVSGIFADNYGFLIPALACLGMSFISLIIAISFLPETLKSENRSKLPTIRAALKRPFEFYTSSTFAGRRLEYTLLIFAFAFGELGMQNRSGMETVYLLGMPFCWTPTLIGYFEVARHFGQSFFGLGSVKLCQTFMSNELIAVTSTVFGLASYIVEGLATSGLAIYMAVAIAAFGFSMVPMIRGILSTITPADKQGSIFASIAAVEVLSGFIAIVSENAIYAATVSVVNGFVFFLIAGYIVVDFILLVLYACIKQNQTTVDVLEVKIHKDNKAESLNADCVKPSGQAEGKDYASSKETVQ